MAIFFDLIGRVSVSYRFFLYQGFAPSWEPDFHEEHIIVISRNTIYIWRD